MAPSIWFDGGPGGPPRPVQGRGRRRRRAGTALLQVVQLLFKVAVRGRVAVGRRHVEEVLVGQVPLVDDQPRRLGRRQDLRAVGQLAVELIDRDAAILVLLGRHPADRFAQRQRAAPGIAHHQHAHRPAVGEALPQQPAGKEHRGVGQRLQGDPPHAERAHRAELGGNERLGVHPVLEPGRGGRGLGQRAWRRRGGVDVHDVVAQRIVVGQDGDRPRPQPAVGNQPVDRGLGQRGAGGVTEHQGGVADQAQIGRQPRALSYAGALLRHPRHHDRVDAGRSDGLDQPVLDRAGPGS